MSKPDKIKKIFLECVNNASLDETILEYICGMLEDDNMLENEEDLFAMISPYLMDSGCASSDDEVATLGRKLLKRMADGGVYHPKKGKQSDLQVLAAPVTLAKKSDDVSFDWMKGDDRNTLVDKDKLVALDSKREKRKEQKAIKEQLKQDKAKANQVQSSFQFQNIHADPNGVTNKPRDIKIENFSIAQGKDTLLDTTNISLA